MADNWKPVPDGSNDDKGYDANALQHSQSAASTYQQQYPGSYQQGAAPLNQFASAPTGSSWGQMQDGGGGSYAGVDGNYYQNSQQLQMMQGGDPSIMQQQAYPNPVNAHGFDMQRYQQHQQQKKFLVDQMVQSSMKLIEKKIVQYKNH